MESSASAECSCSGGAKALIEPLPYDGPEGSKSVLIFIGLGMMALYFAVLVREVGALRACCCRRLTAAFCFVASLPRRWRGEFHHACSDRDARDIEALEACVAQGLQAKIEQNVSGTIHALAHSALFSTGIITFNLSTGRALVHSFGSVCLVFVMSAALFAADVGRPRVLSKWPGIVYGAILGFACVLILVTRPIPMYLIVSDNVALGLRVAMSMKYHKCYPVLFWNVLYQFSSVYAIAHAMGRDFLGFALSYQIWNVGLVVVLCYTVSRDAEVEIRRDLKASVLKCESSGLWNLLDMICVVVVHLDDSLTIVDKASRFAAMVTLQGGSVEGMRLEDFMPVAEDRKAFELCAHAHPDGALSFDTVPRALHVRLRDSLGNLLSVELFCVAFRTPLRRSFFVGIREFCDAPEIRPLTAPRGEARHSAAMDFLRLAGEGQAQRRGDEAHPAPSLSASDSDSLRSVLAAPPRPGCLGRDLAPTSCMGIELALVQLMRLCSRPVGQAEAAVGRCCPFHRRLGFLQDGVTGLAALPCAPGFQAHTAAQCGRCGFLVDSARAWDGHALRCFACQTEVEVAEDAQMPRPSQGTESL